MYQFLKSMGVNPVGIKTYSILIRETQPQLNMKATISNITSELFSIKTTQEVNEVNQIKKNCKQYLSAEQIKYILLELRKHKSFTNDDLGDILVHANCRSKQIDTIMTKIEKIAINGHLSLTQIKTTLEKMSNKQTTKIIKPIVHEVITHKEIVFSDTIGDIKFEFNKYLTNTKIQKHFNILTEIEQPPVNTIELNNEYDLSEIKQVLQANNRTIICADIPGAGKSTSIKNCGAELLFVTPYNKLSQELRKDGFDSVTLHNLLGMGITDEQNKKSKAEGHFGIRSGWF
jgi:hypothetical protein